MSKVKRINVARIAILGIALAAGGLAAFLASGSDQKVEAPPPPPVAQIETAEVLVARADINLGDRVKSDAIGWQTWPAATTSPARHTPSEETLQPARATGSGLAAGPSGSRGRATAPSRDP